jgi:hypothetical protein
MEMHKENFAEKRRRKPVAKSPVLVRSVKPGQLVVPAYSREQAPPVAQLWRS